MPMHAAPRKSVCISDFMSNRGDNIKMDLKEMGCDDVDCITWLMVSGSWVKRTKNLLVLNKVISELEITIVFSRTNLPRELNTFAASYLNTQGLNINNSCLKSPVSTLVDLTFQSRALRSFSLNQLRNLSL